MTYVGRDFDPAEQPESEPFGFDFTRDTRSGEAIMSAAWTVTPVFGSDPDAQTRVLGDAAFSGVLTSQRIMGLLPGVRYKIEATVMTNFGNDLTLHSFCVGDS